VVNATVDDTQVGRVQAGDAAAVTPNGAAAPLPGTVTSVGLISDPSSAVPSFPITIAIAGAPPGLRAGAGAAVSITVRRIDDALAVPSAAVRYDGGPPAVMLIAGGQPRRQPVAVGLSSGGMTQILNGLADGDRVAVPRAPSAGATQDGGSDRGGKGGGKGGSGGQGGRGALSGLGGGS
jgi:multidrug efflux pump subunit AcrA (membrane-fusion protein)